jgi:hypothetical protein
MIQVLAVFYSVLIAFVIVGGAERDQRSQRSRRPQVWTSAFYSQSVSDLSDVTKARRNRNADAADTIPGPLFFLLVVISFAVLGVATLLNTRERGRTSRSWRCSRSSPR